MTFCLRIWLDWEMGQTISLVGTHPALDWLPAFVVTSPVTTANA